MDEAGVPELRSRTGIKVAIAAGGVAAIAVAAAVVWLLFGKTYNHSPTAAEKHALADAVCPKVTASHFYTIVKDGKTSWLLGTRHAGVSLAKYPPAVADAFHAATTVVFEAAYDDSGPATPEPDVADQLGPDDWAKYKALVGDEIAEKMHHKGIQLATVALAVLYEDMSEMIDSELERKAKEQHQRVVGLEDKERTDHLAETYTGAGALRTALQQVPRRELLASETRRTLKQYCVTGERSPGGALDQVTNERTRQWVAKLVPLLEQGGVFIAVGVDHVDRGTLDLGNLLEQQGFTVTRVP